MSRNIALVGPMHSGKSTIAWELERNHGYVRFALADSVKDDVATLLNYWIEAYAPWMRPLTREMIDADKARFRTMLQWFGTEWGREYVGPEHIWIDRLLMKTTQSSYPVVTDDCRFLNEASALRDAGFLIVRVWRPETDRQISLGTAAAVQGIKGHASEIELERIFPDVHVTNDSPDAPALIAASLASWGTA